MQPDAFADAVVVMVKNALGPVLERLSAAEARLAVLGDLRDRVVVMETKALQIVPVPALPDPEVPVVELGPVLERLAATEALLKTIGDLRDRVVVMETKAGSVVPVDLTDVCEKLATLHADVKLAGAVTGSDPKVLDKLEALTTDVNALRERIAVAEMRQLVPGPMGHDGRDGQNGRDGKDGLDGLGWDDLAVEQVNERTFTVKCLRGLQVKELGTLTFPVQIYRGVYVEGKSYDKGDGVTWGGSEWHCNEPTATKPGDGSKAWTLKVKRGRDGKDGSSGPAALPVVRR